MIIACCWEHMLMGLFSRQTVLEPITRFCAYFPDINECMMPLIDIIAIRALIDMLSFQASRNAITNSSTMTPRVPR